MSIGDIAHRQYTIRYLPHYIPAHQAGLTNTMAVLPAGTMGLDGDTIMDVPLFRLFRSVGYECVLTVCTAVGPYRCRSTGEESKLPSESSFARDTGT